MPSGRHKQSKVIEMMLAKIKNIFRKMRLFFSCSRQWNLQPFSPFALFLIRDEKLDEAAQQALNNYKMLFQMLEYRVITEPLKEQIPDEYTGILIVRYGEKQEYQEYLKIQTEYVEKKTLVSPRIPLTDHLKISDDYNNKNHS
jgi:hypothetical protein